MPNGNSASIPTIQYKSILKEKPWLLALALYPFEGIENPELLTYSTRSSSFTMSIYLASKVKIVEPGWPISLPFSRGKKNFVFLLTIKNGHMLLLLKHTTYYIFDNILKAIFNLLGNE